MRRLDEFDNEVDGQLFESSEKESEEEESEEEHLDHVLEMEALRRAARAIHQQAARLQVARKKEEQEE